MTSNFSQKPINLYLSTEHDCSYLDDRQSNSLFVDPEAPMNVDIYSKLIQQGFRRSGSNVYTPYCKKCHDCIPVRLDVQEFILSRSQKRCRNKNKHLIVSLQNNSTQNTEQYDLYRAYVQSRHPDGGMDDPDIDSYLDFLTASWSNTAFFELRESERLVAVAVTDIVKDAFSAVYTFFDPSEEYQQRSLGIYSVLWQAEEAKRQGLKWLYLGYWIHGCQKMSYKDNYQPLEYFYSHQWHSNPPPQIETELSTPLV